MNNRSGSIMIITIGAVALVAAMALTLSERLQGISQIQTLNQSKQKALYAAESVAALREARLVNVAAANDLANLTRNPDTGLADDPWEGIQYFGGCIVRWRIEPLRVEDDDDNWINNPPANPSEEAELVGLDGRAANTALYHYRIAAQAFTLTNPSLLDGTTIDELEASGQLPWQNGNNANASVQSVRIAQLRLNSLFRYALFYAAEGLKGDMEIGPGLAQDITGDVHSNGCIYFAGGFQSTRYKPSGWGAALIGSSSKPVNLVGVDGVVRLRKDHLLRAYMDSGHSLYNPVLIDTPEPLNVPVSGSTSNSNLNDTQNASGGSPNHKLNNISFTYADDSRSPATLLARHGSHMRDGINGGATIVKTLANIPELAGRPFEHQRLFPSGTHIWTKDSDNPELISAWTVLPNNPPGRYFVNPQNGNFHFTDTPSSTTVDVRIWCKKLWFNSDPFESSSYSSSALTGASLLNAIECDNDNNGILDNSGVTLANAWIVDADGLRQYYQRNADGSALWSINNIPTKNIIDIFDPAGIYLSDDSNANSFNDNSTVIGPDHASFYYNGVPVADLNGDGISDNAVPGQYLEWAENGRGDEPDKRGLIIRERRNQREPDIDHQWTSQPAPPASAAGSGSGSGSSSYNAKVTVERHSGSTNSSTSADGVRFTNTATGATVIVDNNAGVGYTENGSWYTSGGPSPYNGSSRYTSTSGRSVDWEANLNGTYTVEIWYTYYSSRDTNAKYTVSGDGVTDTVFYVNQKSDAGNWRMLTIGGSPATFTFGSTPVVAGGTFGENYANYLASQYHVQLGKYDITDLFFAYATTGATSDTDMICFERDILDRREAVYMQYTYWDQDSSHGSSDWTAYTVNTLTIDMQKTLNFLKNTPWSSVDTSYVGSSTAMEYFSGLLYMHRTRRSASYQPWTRMRWHPDNYRMWTSSINHSTASARYDWRTGSSPEHAFHSAFRIKNGHSINLDQDFVDDNGTATTNDDYRTKKGLTIATPNQLYMWGNYNTTKYADSSSSSSYGTARTIGSSNYSDSSFKLPPCAIFADNVNILSNRWADTSQSPYSKTSADETWLYSSVITNHIPTHVDGKNNIQSSEGTHNIIRYNENWGSTTFHLLGSNVVMNDRRYGRGPIAYGYEPESKNQDVYDPPNRDFDMNDDLFSKPGQPPFSPFGVEVIRTAHSVHLIE